jgi:hypothetical protein
MSVEASLISLKSLLSLVSLFSLAILQKKHPSSLKNYPIAIHFTVCFVSLKIGKNRENRRFA